MEATEAVDKLIFLFPRKDGLTREEFFAHYLDVHAPLGLEVTRTMVHYTVNLCDRDGGTDDGVDAITETWTDSVADFMNPDKSFATPEDAQRLFTDHDSFVGAPYEPYAVEEHVAALYQLQLLPVPADRPHHVAGQPGRDHRDELDRILVMVRMQIDGDRERGPGGSAGHACRR